jgi:hypothetical protein
VDSSAPSDAATTAIANTGLPSVEPESPPPGNSSSKTAGANRVARPIAATATPVPIDQRIARSRRLAGIAAPRAASTTTQATVISPSPDDVVRAVRPSRGSTPTRAASSVATTSAPPAIAMRRSAARPEATSARHAATSTTSFPSPKGLAENGVNTSGRATTSRNRPISASRGRRASMTWRMLVPARGPVGERRARAAYAGGRSFAVVSERNEPYTEPSERSPLRGDASHRRRVAQLGRAPVSKTGGWGFKSLRACKGNP